MTLATMTYQAIQELELTAYFDAHEFGIAWASQNIAGHEIMVTIDSYDDYTEYAIVQNDVVVIWSTSLETIINSMVAVI